MIYIIIVFLRVHRLFVFFIVFSAIIIFYYLSWLWLLLLALFMLPFFAPIAAIFVWSIFPALYNWFELKFLLLALLHDIYNNCFLTSPLTLRFLYCFFCDYNRDGFVNIFWLNLLLTRNPSQLECWGSFFWTKKDKH